MRAGILGGTFNPIHYGHLRSAEEVREALGLDEVRFIPLAEPAHKPNGGIAPAADRLEMVRLATGDNPAFVCDPIEVERGGVSYTVETMAALAEGSCRGQETFFIIGADAFRELHTWREPLALLGMTNFAVTLREEQSREEVLAALAREMGRLAPSFSLKETGESSVQVVDSNREIHFTSISTFDISGTDVRRRAGQGGSLRYLLPPSVEGFIIRRGLYGYSPPAGGAGGKEELGEGA
ncbi:MAG: nicotinate-nucleotide adenylyltransferase [bacterium]